MGGGSPQPLERFSIEAAELMAIGDAVAEAGHGTFEIISDRCEDVANLIEGVVLENS